MTAEDQRPIPPQRHRYFIRHPGFNILFRMLDFFLRVATKVARRPKLNRQVRRVLVTNCAHLGDVVLATAVLPEIKAAYPEARIGILVGSWASQVVKGNPLLDWIHHVDHWRLSRAMLPLRAKVAIWWQTRRQALKEIRDVDYDIAIDLYFYFPNSIALLWQSGIPCRIGYANAGLGPLLTKALNINMESNQRSIIDLNLDLVRELPNMNFVVAEKATPFIARHDIDVALLSCPKNYTVLHLGAGAPLKEWPESSWVTLAQQLLKQGNRLVLTGHGHREKNIIHRFRKHVPEALDLCERLTWKEFVEVIANARLLIVGDSVAAHIATAVNTPTIVIAHGMTNPHLWRPTNPRSRVLMNQVQCAPCYRNSGCASMECLRKIDPLQVLAEANQLVSRAVN